MPEMNRPVESVSTETAEQLFASAARAMGGNRGRAVGYNRVSIPVSGALYRELFPEVDEPTTAFEPVAQDDWEEAERFDFRSTAYIPSAVVFDSYEDEYEEDDYEPTNADIEEEVAFSALADALDRHADVYGDMGRSRSTRFHDYGFGMGITFDGPSYFDDDEEEDI